MFGQSWQAVLAVVVVANVVVAAGISPHFRSSTTVPNAADVPDVEALIAVITHCALELHVSVMLMSPLSDVPRTLPPPFVRTAVLESSGAAHESVVDNPPLTIFVSKTK